MFFAEIHKSFEFNGKKINKQSKMGVNHHNKVAKTLEKK